VQNKSVKLFLSAACFLFISISISAHHGAAGFDTERELPLKGTVTEWIWSNPHCLLKFDVTDDAGNIVHWAAEGSNPIGMTERGWSKQILKPGDKVALTVRPAKNGAPVGQLLKVVLPNGQALVGWPSQLR
jgi:hypothetical protein